MLTGAWMLWRAPQTVITATGPKVVREHVGGSAFKLSGLGFDTTLTVYVGFLAVAVNLLVAVIATTALRASRVPIGQDATRSWDYQADAGDPRVHDLDSRRPESIKHEPVQH